MAARTSKYEKEIAVEVPEWNIDNCIQCNKPYSMPHAAIRPSFSEEEIRMLLKV